MKIFINHFKYHQSCNFHFFTRPRTLYLLAENLQQQHPSRMRFWFFRIGSSSNYLLNNEMVGKRKWIELMTT